MIRVGLAAFVAAAVLLSGGSARAALPAYVQKNLTVTYSGSTTCSPASECFNGTVTPISLAYTVQSTAGNSATVQTNNGGPFTCTDGTVCASFFQFWVDPANPVYFMSNVDQNAGQQLAVTTAGCASTQLCMSFSNSNTSGGNTTRRSATLKFDANSGILVSYVSTVVNVANGTSLQQDQTTTTSFNLASPFPLSVVNSGNGTVSGSPSGISCGAVCAADFNFGTVVTLTPTPNPGFTFSGWGGACSGTGTCAPTMDSVKGVAATFLQSQMLSVTEAGNGTGVVTSNPPGINCSNSSNQCSGTFGAGSVVTLTASASSGSAFSGWSGGVCSGTGPCQVTLNAATTVTATFNVAITTNTLTINRGGAGSGTVNSNPSGIACGGTCTASFAQGTQVTLSGAADNGSTFAGWSGAGCSGIKNCTIALNADMTVGATFVQNTSTAINLVAAVLPASRSVQVGNVPATAFATIINAGPGDASTCSIAPATSLPASFDFQTTDPATNAVTGTANTPVDVAQGAFQTFVFAFTPTAPFDPTDVIFNFACANAAPASTTLGVNTLNLSAAASPVPDVVALAASADPGRVDIDPGSNAGAFAVATVNVGSSATITASADTGAANLPIGLTICQTDPSSGNCLSPPVGSSVLTMIGANATPTFGIFVTGNGGAVPDMPAVNRVFVRFIDSGGVLRGETSVAVRTH